MSRRLALVALWVVFAVASVGVGFAAAGLVGDPFTDGGTIQAVPGGGSSTPTASRSPSSSGTPTSSAAPSGAGGEQVTRSLSSRGGLVSATCRDGLVQLSASPAVGWEIEDIDDGRQREARVRFERSEDGDGRVEIRAVCTGAGPQFELDDDSSGHDGDGESGD